MAKRTPKEALQAAAALLGGQVRVAEVCGYEDRRHVWPWFREQPRQVPPDKCARLERAVGARIACEQLRPDLPWGRIEDHEWPHPKGRPVLEVTRAT